MSRQFVKLEVTISETAIGSEMKAKVLNVNKGITEDFIEHLDESYDVFSPKIINKIVSLSRKKSTPAHSETIPKGKVSE